MRFKNQEDNENLIRRLDHIVKSDKISHAYIFEGDNCIDKKAFADSFIKGILCKDHRGENCGRCGMCDKVDHGNHEDIIYVSSDGSSIKDARIIEVQERLKTKPFGERNIVVIEDSDAMTTRAQNRFLKTLEEPPGKAVIILLSENIENLLQTIQSRCVKYRINYFGSDGYDSMMEDTQQIVEMLLKRRPFYSVKDKVDKIAKDKEDVAAFLDCLQVIYRNLLLKKDRDILLIKDEELINNIYAVETARKQIKQGVSAAYAVRNLILKIGG